MPTDRITAYQSLRQSGKEFCAKLLGVIPMAVFVSAAQELGLWRSGVLVADEGDTDVMTDRIIYDGRWNGRSCIEHFESTNAGIGLGKGETRFLAAMKTARFSLYAILEIHPGAHAVLSDRLAEIRNGQPEPPLDLLDLGLSQTGMPGALLATGCWLGLQALGGVYVRQVLAGSSQTYGGFAAVAGLLTWLLIASELVLLAAELNVVLARGLWPRSLTGELLDADKQALRDSAHAAQLDRRQQIAVRFDQRVGLPHGREPGEERSVPAGCDETVQFGGEQPGEGEIPRDSAELGEDGAKLGT